MANMALTTHPLLTSGVSLTCHPPLPEKYPATSYSPHLMPGLKPYLRE